MLFVSEMWTLLDSIIDIND